MRHIEIARVICDECYKEVLKDFPEATLENLEEKARQCAVFNHNYALCPKHLQELAERIDNAKS